MTTLIPKKNLEEQPTGPDFTMQAAVGTSTPHVFYHPHLQKYFYSDETQCMCERPYDTEALAAQGLRDYATFSLDGPELLNEIERRIEAPELEPYECIHIARAAFKDRRGEDGILALRAGVHKLAVHDERLAKLVRNVD